MATSAAGFDEAARAIRALDLEFITNVKAKDAARLVDSFYAEDARLLPPDHAPVSGKAAIREFWQAVLAGGVTAVELDTTHIEASGDLAYGVGAFVIRREPGSGPAEYRGKYVVVYRRGRDGAWKAAADMFSGNG
jgi:uncharacterized protein (TIGR02246 family)